MDEKESFWSKKPEDLNVADQLKFVALVPAVMLAGFVAPAVVIGAVDKVRTRFRNRKQPQLTVVETPTDEVQ